MMERETSKAIAHMRIADTEPSAMRWSHIYLNKYLIYKLYGETGWRHELHELIDIDTTQGGEESFYLYSFKVKNDGLGLEFYVFENSSFRSWLVGLVKWEDIGVEINVSDR